MEPSENDGSLRSHSDSRWTRLAWIGPLAAVVYVLAQALAAVLLAGMPIGPPQVSPAVSPGQQMAWALVSATILAGGIVPIVPRLSGGFVPRWLVLAAFLYVVHAVNTAIEMTIFTRLGGGGYVAAMGLLPALLCAAVLATVPPARAAPLGPVDQPSAPGLAWRLALGWLAFPAAYFVFGTMISPLVVEAYSAPDSVLVLPPTRVVISVQAVRSVLYLLPTLAVMERWTGSQVGLWLALGWAHWALVGLSGLAIPNEFMSTKLRLVHSLEIGADSFAYTGILVAVLARRLGMRPDLSLVLGGARGPAPI